MLKKFQELLAIQGIKKTFLLNVCLLFLSSFFLLSCNKNIEYQIGLITTKVVGNITLNSNSTNITPFVFVQEHHRTFLDFENQPLYYIQAKIVYPDENGNYSVVFPSQVSKIDLLFIATKYVPQAKSFKRTLGVNTLTFNPILEVDYNWKNNFILQMKPFLSGFITEPRYQTPKKDQLFLSNWIRNMEDLIL